MRFALHPRLRHVASGATKSGSPSQGGVESGETLAAAAVLELFEETVIRIDEDNLVGPVHVGTHSFTYRGIDRVNDSTFFAVAPDDVVVNLQGARRRRGQQHSRRCLVEPVGTESRSLLVESATARHS